MLTLEDPQDHFDGIVFGEIAPTKWMAGSDGFCRTQKDQSACVAETADANALVQMAIVYHPPGMSMWDTWYLQRGDETHVFHLQLRRDKARRGSDDGSIGHAVSRDLIHWKDLPVALRKGPQGSHDDSWSLFTGCAV